MLEKIINQEFKNKELKTAVLFLVFNRPDTTKQVFEAIRKAKPPRLYVAGDGPREGKLGEVERVEEVKTITMAVDWPCEVKTLFRDKNLGCKYAVSRAITWFFEQEEQGIILEDDCLPSPSFFKFCEIMFDKYRGNKSVWMINGFNPHHPGISSSEYFLSQNPSAWGWASWRDRWVHYAVDIDYVRKEPYWLTSLKLPDYVISYYDKAFSNTASRKIDTWDYQLSFLILKNNGYVIKSFANLINNIGVYGTHSNSPNHNHNVPIGLINLEKLIMLPSNLGMKEDLWFFKKNLKNNLLNKIFNFFS
jgi:hypothetical protein